MRAASTTYLRANDVLTPNDLLNLLLIGSDNAAAARRAVVAVRHRRLHREDEREGAGLGLEHTPTSIRRACSR